MPPQFTFGENISNTLGRVIQNNQQARMAARQLNRQLRNDAFSRKISELSTRIKQKRLELDEEAQEQKIINAAIQNEIDRKREERLGELTDARIKNLLREDESSDGVAPESLISAFQSLINVSNKQLSDISDERRDREADLEAALQQPARERERQPSEEDQGIFFGPTDEEIQIGQQRIREAERDSARAAQRLNQLNRQEDQAQQNLQRLQSALQRVINGFTGAPERQDNDNDLPVVTSEEDFNELQEGDRFLLNGQVQVKVNDTEFEPAQ